jgi:general secretion pathway protein D
LKQLGAVGLATWIAVGLFALAAPVAAQIPNGEEGMVTLDFADVELAAVIETIAKMTGQNFIYDDRVRGRVTIVSPTPMPVEQAYAVFESVLQVKGFTTVKTPGGAIKVVPVREAKESSVETVISSRRPPNRDRFVTRLIPLNYIDAESIVNTLKPLVSKDASMAAYAPTNTVILTESSSNIRRLIAVLESIDVETYKEELAVIGVEHADAATLAEQVSQIYGAEVSSAATPAAARRATRRRGQTDTTTPSAGKRKPVRILTDERTNSLLVLAARPQLEEVRRLIAKLDVPVRGGGRIHVYYLNNANAEELAQTLSGLLGGGGSRAVPTPAGSGGGAAAPPAIRSAVASLSGGISVTADPATNSLIIQASKEGFDTLSRVIEKLDVERPQVLVEALIVEVDVSDARDLGFSAIYRTINGDSDFIIASATDAASAAAAGSTGGASELLTAGDALQPFIGRFRRDQLERDAEGNPIGGSIIDSVIRLSATEGDIDIVSAPHILTSDNEQAEIRVGDNIPIISSRVESAAGISTDGLSSSVNVERQDIGVTLRVTPQITEGDTLRLEIFQEITAINEGLLGEVGNVNDVGVPLSNRRIENTVVVGDGETVVIGGLISDQTSNNVVKVPFLGDIPILGWAFKSTSTSTEKRNLLVFLTPRIVRSPLDLESETIRKREQFQRSTGENLAFAEDEFDEEQRLYAEAVAEGKPYYPGVEGDALRTAVTEHMVRYPLERMREIEETKLAEYQRLEAERLAGERPPSYWLQAAILSDPEAASALLTDLIDSGHDGTLVSQESGAGVMYQLQLGPYPSLAEAETHAAVLERSHGLTPTVLVRTPSEEALPQQEESP